MASHRRAPFSITPPQAWLPLPSSLALAVTKASLVAAALIPLAGYVAIVQPYPAIDAWKAPVKVMLLLLTVACAAVNAAATAMGLGYGGASLGAGIRAASYVLFAACCVTVSLLVVGFGWSTWSSAGREEKAIVEHRAEELQRKAGEEFACEDGVAMMMNPLDNEETRERQLQQLRKGVAIESSAAALDGSAQAALRMLRLQQARERGQPRQSVSFSQKRVSVAKRSSSFTRFSGGANRRSLGVVADDAEAREP